MTVRALAMLSSALLGVPAAAAASHDTIIVRDLTPKFMSFYRAATQPGISADERFALWKKDYGFAAVPPTSEGDKIARSLLDNAWSRYPSALPRIERGAAGLKPSPEATLKRVEALLKPERPVKLTLIVYVGGFEGNAFTVGEHGQPTVAVPIEETAAERGPVMTHEFVHAVQISMGTMSGGWVRSVGETVLAEGLAMRVTERLYPNLPPRSFVEMSSEPGWLKRAELQRGAIIADVRKVVSSNSSDDVFRYTMGTGPSGIDREAYYAGWIVVNYWLRHGMTFADIARIPEQQAPARVGKALDALATEHGAVRR